MPSACRHATCRARRKPVVTPPLCQPIKGNWLADQREHPPQIGPRSRATGHWCTTPQVRHRPPSNRPCSSARCLVLGQIWSAIEVAPANRCIKTVGKSCLVRACGRGVLGAAKARTGGNYGDTKRLVKRQKCVKTCPWLPVAESCCGAFEPLERRSGQRPRAVPRAGGSGGPGVCWRAWSGLEGRLEDSFRSDARPWGARRARPGLALHVGRQG